VFAAAVAALLVPAVAAARQSDSSDGRQNTQFNAVYTATNDPTGNSIVVYHRGDDGTLVRGATVPTGGVGLASEPPFGFPIVDSSGSINLTPDGRLLFVVNAGDNTVSSFRVDGNGVPRLVDRESSNGVLPVSLSSNGHLLYVVNELSGNISGYSFSESGKLTPIAGSTRSLSIPGPDGIAAAVGFSPNGRVLVVTERYLPLAGHEGTAQNGVIDTFTINTDGSANPVQGHTAATPTPFGFTFSGPGHLLTSSAGAAVTASGEPPEVFDPTQFNGSAESYNLTDSGALTPTSNAPSHGRATCWIVVTNDGKYAFGSNTLSGSDPNTIGSGISGLSRFAVAPDGTVTFLGNTNVTPNPAGVFPSDLALSHDSQFLYVSAPSIFAGPSHIEAYRIGAGGSLTDVGSTPEDLPNSASGIAAY
jgi:6-phosphogluconolactonase (cycloisomerase 2 family)